MSEALERVQDVTSQSPMDEMANKGNVQSMHRGVTYDALVLDAGLRQSLAAIRSLGERGLRVAAVDTSPGVPAFSSRWCQQAFICPADEGGEAYFSYLEELLGLINVRVLIMASDATVALIRKHREQLEGRVQIALAKEPALGIAISKERTLEIARRLGIRVPLSLKVESLSQVDAALDEIGLPAIIKPVESWASNEQEGTRLGCLLVTTPDEARLAVEDLTRFGGCVLFQQFLSGRRESVSILYAHGQIYAYYAQWHTHSIHGASALRQSIAVPPDIGSAAEQLVRGINLEGIAEVEFRRDSAGKLYLMEVNPRLWSSTELAVRSGVDFPYLLYQWASGEEIDMMMQYPIGGRLRYLRGEIYYTVTALMPSWRKGWPDLEITPPLRAILDFCFNFFIPTGYDYVHWRDPLPVLTAIGGFMREALQWIGKSFK